MKRILSIALLTAFAAVAHAGDTKDGTAACCAPKAKTPTSLATTAKADDSAPAAAGCCCSKPAKKVAKQVVLTPKGAELARR